MHKQFIGYHKTDGGKVYKTGLSNSLIDFYSCATCGKSTTSGNLNIARDVVADTTALWEAHVGETKDFIGTDDDIKNGYLELISILNNTPWLNLNLTADIASNVTDVETKMADISTAIGIVYTQNSSFFSSMMSNIGFDSNTDFTDNVLGEFSVFDGFIKVPALSLDVATNLVHTTSLYTKQAIDTTGHLETITYTTPTSHRFFNVCFGYQKTTTASDWVRGVNIKAAITNDDGITWTTVKFPTATTYDTTGTTEYKSTSTLVDAGSDSTTIKCRVEFIGNDELNIDFFALSWQYDPVDNDVDKHMLSALEN